MDTALLYIPAAVLLVAAVVGGVLYAMGSSSPFGARDTWLGRAVGVGFLAAAALAVAGIVVDTQQGLDAVGELEEVHGVTLAAPNDLTKAGNWEVDGEVKRCFPEGIAGIGLDEKAERGEPRLLCADAEGNFAPLPHKK